MIDVTVGVEARPSGGDAMHVIASTEASVTETPRAEGIARRRDYVGSGGTITPGPQAFLVERLYPQARIDPHFHDVDQFQVVVVGDGRIGKKPVGPVTFQYADAYTPYGPIVANEAGIAFFTLRPVASGGHFSMPGNRHRMPCRAGRNLAGVFAAQAAPTAGTAIREDLLPADEDGVAAVGFRLGAHASMAGPPSDAGGQYYLVCDGALMADAGRALERHSLIHVGPGEAAPMLTAGPAGAAVLMLQFCRPGDRPGSDVRLLAGRDPASYVNRH